MPERQVIGRVAGRVDDVQFGVARRDHLAVGDRSPGQRIPRIAFRPRVLGELRPRPPAGKRGCPGNVITMCVADHDMTWSLGACRCDRIDVSRETGAGIDQNRMPAGKEIGPVAGAGHRPGIGGMQGDNQKNTFKRA